MSDKISNKTDKTDQYDPHIIPAETAARQEREGENYKEFPEHEGDLDTAGGYTMDREGLVNNFAVEPEMYINEPGDLREEAEADKARRAEELEEINQPGGKGPGLV